MKIMWAKQDVGLEWFATWETSILQHSILPMLPLNWNRPSPHSSRAAGIFHFRLIRIHSNAGNFIWLKFSRSHAS